MSEHIPKTAFGTKADWVVKDQYIPDLSVESKEHILMLLIKANAKIQQIEKQNKIMREALEFYGDGSKYQGSSHDPHHVPVVVDDCGFIARQALKEVGEV